MTGTNLTPELNTPTSRPPDAAVQGLAVHAFPSSSAVTLSSGRRYEIDATPSGDRLVVRSRKGEVVLQIEVTDAGPRVSFASLQPVGDGGAPDERVLSLSAIVPPPRSGEQDPDGAGDEEVYVPRATPLPAFRHPAETESPYLATGAPNLRNGVWPGSRGLRVPGNVNDSAFISDPELTRAGTIVSPRLAQQPDAEPVPTQRAATSLSLEQYAMLCAESKVSSGAKFEQALLRYGIAGQDAWVILDRGWQDRLAREPILTLRWMDLTARYREHLTRR